MLINEKNLVIGELYKINSFTNSLTQSPFYIYESTNSLVGYKKIINDRNYIGIYLGCVVVHNHYEFPNGYQFFKFFLAKYGIKYLKNYGRCHWYETL